MITVWFLLALIAFPSEPAINYKGYYAYHTKNDCEMQKVSLENFVAESELLRGRDKEMYIETFCLEMQAFPEQLERYKKEKDKGIKLGGKELGREA